MIEQKITKLQKILLDIGSKIIFTLQETTTTGLFILALDFYWPIQCGKCF